MLFRKPMKSLILCSQLIMWPLVLSAHETSASGFYASSGQSVLSEAAPRFGSSCRVPAGINFQRCYLRPETAGVGSMVPTGQVVRFSSRGRRRSGWAQMRCQSGRFIRQTADTSNCGR